MFALNSTGQMFAECEIVCKSVFRILAASLGRSTVMYGLVSSAKSQIEPPMRCHNVINGNKKNRGPSIDP